MATPSPAITVLAESIKEFIGIQPLVQLDVRSDGVINNVVGPDEHKELFRRIKRLGRNALLTKTGTHRILTADSLKRNYGYEVVPITFDDEGWLDVGIKTPIGIIQYDNA